MSNDRLLEIESHLQILYEQKVSLEREILLSNGLQRTQTEQRLKLEVRPKIKEYEEEYWKVFSQHSGSMEISEQEAKVVVAEIVEQVSKIELNSSDYTIEVLTLLREIRDKLNQPGSSATAKLKGVISSIPPFVGISYEAELDTENFLNKHFPTFTSFVKGTIKKKLP
jgi:hypothetical protein